MNCGFNAELSNSYPWIQVGTEATTLINPLLPLSPRLSCLLLLLLLLSPVSLYHRVGLTPCRSYHRAVVKYCNLTKLLVLFLKHLGIVKSIHFGEVFSILFRFFFEKMLSKHLMKKWRQCVFALNIFQLFMTSLGKFVKYIKLHKNSTFSFNNTVCRFERVLHHLLIIFIPWLHASKTNTTFQVYPFIFSVGIINSYLVIVHASICFKKFW